MTKYIVKRLLLAVLTVFIICAITFFLMHAIPGGPFNREKALDPATIAALNARYNLDKPLVTQFGIYLKELLKGDFGVSLKNGREISSIKTDIASAGTIAFKSMAGRASSPSTKKISTCIRPVIP